MNLFRKKPKPSLDAPQAAEKLRRAIANAVARAESHGVSGTVIVTTMRNAIASKEYCDVVNARSSYDTLRTVEITHSGTGC
jgi:hypothetical protein